jgi:hypothetical protein
MTTTKNPGLGARMGSVSAALAAKASSPSTSTSPAEEEIVATSVRLPKAMHDALRRIVFEEGNRGKRVSIHSLLLEGAAKVIKERK